MKHRIIYNKEECIEIAKGYVTRSEFRKRNWIAFIQCKENGWLDEVFPSKINVLTYDKCYNVAKSYNDYSTFRCSEVSIYSKSIKKGWLKDFYWLERGKRDINARINCVYAYEFKNHSYVYIGRTMDKSRRYNQHLHDKSDSVYKFMLLHDLSEKDFVYKIIQDNLSLYESAELECRMICDYYEKGWNLINRARGGSIGSYSIKWDYENTYNTAKKYVYLKDFVDNNVGAYNAARKNGWLKDYIWLENFKPSKIYSYEECYNKAKEYKTHNEFLKNACSYVSFSKRKGWYKDYVWLKNKRHNSVIEYDLNGDFVKCHKKLKTKECGGICNCANGRIKTHNNRIWKYEEDVLDCDGNIKKHIDYDITPSNFRQIVQYDKEGKFVKEYKKISDTGFCSSSILDALKSKTIYSHGFIWRYKEEVLDNDGKIIRQINNIRRNKALKSLLQYDKEGNFIMEYKTQTEAIKQGFKRKHIEWTANKKFNKFEEITKFSYIWILKNKILEKYDKIPQKLDIKHFFKEDTEDL